MAYRILAKRYSDNESLLEPITDIITAVDSVRNTGHYSASASPKFIEDIPPDQQRVHDELNTDIATPSSIDRYESALGELTGVPSNADSVGDLTVEQECLSKATEWRQRA